MSDDIKKRINMKKILGVNKLAIFSVVATLSLPISLRREELVGKNYNLTSINKMVEDEYSFSELETMVLQGICSVGDNTFITAYDSSDDKGNSVVYILDKNNNCIKEVALYNNSHVGGICYDDKNEMFWITDKGGTISGYTYNSIFDNKGQTCTPRFKKIDVGSGDLINYKGNASAGYITYDDGKLYVGNFSIDGNGVLKTFDVLKDGNIDLDSCRKIKFLDKVQGISFYKKDGEKYLLVSCSFGRFNNSELKVFKYRDNCLDYSKEIYTKCEMPPMLEQIAFNKDGKLITLYEGNAKKYGGLFQKKNSDVIVMDIDDVFSESSKNTYKVM